MAVLSLTMFTLLLKTHNTEKKALYGSIHVFITIHMSCDIRKPECGCASREDTGQRCGPSFHWAHIYFVGRVMSCPCAGPGSLVRGGPTVTTCFFVLFFNLMRGGGGRIQIPLLAGQQRPASETRFKWRFAGGPMMAQH